MDQLNQQASSESPAARAAAFSVHIFTALGAGIALICTPAIAAFRRALQRKY